MWSLCSSGQKFQTSVERVLRIWKDRRVYENRFVKELQLLIGKERKTNKDRDMYDFFAEPNRVDELGTEVSTTPSVSDFKVLALIACVYSLFLACLAFTRGRCSHRAAQV